jgi:RNA polymerase sigma factor FliA
MPSKKQPSKSSARAMDPERPRGGKSEARSASKPTRPDKRRKPGANAAQGKPKAALPKRGTERAAKAPAPVAAPKAKKRDPNARPSVAELHELPTEEIWTWYRKAATAKPRDDAWIEILRNVLMELHYPLVRHIAERLLQTLPKSIELDDLVSAGLFGLMDAIRGFDPSRGIKFKTYCTTRIRGSILDQLRSQDWVPRLVRLKASRIEKALQRLQGEYGREPTHAELADNLRMDHGELSNEIVSARAKTMFSLSERWDDRDDDSSMEKVEIVEDKDAVDPIGELNRRDLMVYITRSLTHKERFIIEQYYQVGHTMREIGEMLALTESRVCQIHSNVMARLKGLLGPSSNSLSL